MPEHNSVLDAWNLLPFADALEELLPCNGSSAWAEAMTESRPFASPEALFLAADDLWRAIGAADWEQAFASHPRIGERHADATAQSLAWSAGEQSAGVSSSTLGAELTAANRAYEARFGRVFLVCATGKSLPEMLGLLGRRLRNDAGTELLEAAEQQRRITQLRLRKWLRLPAIRCDDV